MKKIKLLLPVLMLFLVCGMSKTVNAQCGNLYIAGVIDGPLTGGTPKGIQLCASSAIVDLSIYGVGSANNGGGTDGEEFTFPADALNAGDCVWLASESIQFENFLGFAPCYTDGTAGVNGDDAIELFCSGAVVDIFGDINCDPNSGTGCETTPTWEYLDSWAVSNDAVANPTFDIAEWTVAPINTLDGEATNAAAGTPYPNAVANCPGLGPVCTLVLSTETVACVTTTLGENSDTYTVTIPFDNGTEGAPGAAGYAIMTAGAIGGDNPMTAATGNIILTFTEGIGYSYQITGTAGNPNETCDLTVSGASPACEPAATCEITDITIDSTTPACNADGTYTVTLTTAGGPDASVAYTDANASIAGDDPATTANAATTFTYPIGTDANIAVSDTDAACTFGPFTATSPAADTGVDYMAMTGDCDTSPQITLPAGYTCVYTYLTSTFAGNTGTGGVAMYPAAIANGDSGTVQFTVTTPCGLTETVDVNFICTNCEATILTFPANPGN